jgi:LPXTG-motif cell wall-anchored protein
MDNCAYLHAVATSSRGYAMSHGAPETGGAADMGTLLIIGAAAAGALILIGVLLLSRRRPSKGHAQAP